MLDPTPLLTRIDGLALRTPRLLIRRFVDTDHEVAMAHELDRRIMRFIRDPMPRDELEERVRAFAGAWHGEEGEWIGLPIVPQEGGDMIGIVAFRIESMEREAAEIGYRIHPDHQRKGYALEATTALLELLFDVGGMRRVTAYCVAENAPSARMMERLGMQHEATFREYSYIDGAWRDELVYAILAAEWRERG